MADTARVTVKLDLSKLQALADKIQGSVGDAVEVVGWQCANEASKRAPVDTGALQNSIMSESHREGDKFIVQDGVDYGIYQEFGFKHWISGESIPAQPFMLSGVLAGCDGFVEEVGKWVFST